METEYQQLLKRYEFLREQREDLHTSVLHLIEIIKNVKKISKDGKSDEIRQKIQTRYKKATRKIGATRRNLKRVDDIIHVVGEELEKLKAKEVTEKIYEDTLDNSQKVLLISEISDELLDFLANHPSYLYQLDSRKFEKLIARIFQDFGYDVELTKATHDGGKDLILRAETPLGLIIALAECKRYAPDRAVGIETVRSLYGVQVAENANKSIIVTTSFFSKEAQMFASGLSCLIDLHEYHNIVTWLNKYKENT